MSFMIQNIRNMFEMLYQRIVEYDHNLLFFQSKGQHRAENEDFYNNETFGSSEYPSQERAEEERRRRGKITFLFFFLVLSSCQ